MKNLVSRFVKDESGATAIEYGLIAAGIAIAIITAVNGVGTKLSTQLRHDLDLAEISDRRNLLQRPRSPGAFVVSGIRDFAGAVSCRPFSDCSLLADRFAGCLNVFRTLAARAV